MSRRGLLVFLVCLFVLAPLSGVRALTVLPFSLSQLSEQAGRIFVGRCESVETALDEHGWPSTYARFQVTEGLKGAATGGTVLVKQFGAAQKAISVGEGESAVVSPKTMTLSGGTYRPGAEYLLFLYPESDLGFTSPVGGGQGRFEIGGSGASALAVNPLNNRFLKTLREGPVPLNEMVQAIREIVNP
jgi:hypothetical protein